MKKNGIITSVVEAIKDSDRVLEERMYLALAVVSEMTVFIALIGDICVRENIWEILTLASVLIMVPTVSLICLKADRMGIAIKFTVISLIFLILPCLFFFGGGLRGGGMLWIVFAFTYVGLVLNGSWRNVMLLLVFISSGVYFLVDYYHPMYVYPHARFVHYVDIFLSLVLNGVVCFAMNRIQNGFLKGEANRARKAAEKADELTRAQNRFFSSMSHEIRTPINSILGLNELILRDTDASEEIVKDATGIQGSGKMLLALINDILDFSKMEAGSMEIVPVDYKVGDMISEIVNMIWIRANDKDLAFNVTIDPSVPSVLYGDEVRIKQVIINLLNNAVKYTAEGSVDLHLESLRKDDDSVELSFSIADTGMGIKKEALPDLFDAFKRVDEEKNRNIEGTGLGLSIVKQLVDLMGGTITVNSVYGEGSTFTVVVDQGISDDSAIGDLNIHNYGRGKREAYESSFRAPEARILIVDDNEMNLEVESKLLSETDMVIDMATSGRGALELALEYSYDVILMDHLMPEMDGIECLEQLRNQVGGRNRTTPVIVLTANAGGKNREAYNYAGFDGYLVKPVSGETLENTLVKYIPQHKLIINSDRAMRELENIEASAGYSGKMPVIVTSTTMCDLPAPLIKKLNIPLIPFLIKTEEGIFKDGIQMDANELIRYLNSGKNAESAPPDESAYTEFFASVLTRAHHLIHIALTTSMSTDYARASEAAKAFDNVTVINSESVSSATGLLVLIAQKLTQMNMSVEDIVANLESVKHRLKCSFIIDNTAYMAKRGFIGPRMDRIVRSLNLHPCIKVQNDHTGIGGFWTGKRQRTYKRYIAKAFPVDVIPDPEVVFITYVDVPVETLLWIKEEISKIAYFEHVLFKQASAAISSNCGPGAFGILYFVKTNKSYNLSSFLVDVSEDIEEKSEDEHGHADEGLISMDVHTASQYISEYETLQPQNLLVPKPEEEEPKWYDSIPGIDGALAITNSGSEDAFKTVLKIFYDSIQEKKADIEGFYASGDWDNYTIKVHALKSSAKLIGALETADKAQLLENAGKAGDTDYIHEHHAAFMEEFAAYRDVLAEFFEEDTVEETPDKPVADAYLMESVYEGLREAAEGMDVDAIEEILQEMEEYAVPEEEREKYQSLCDMANQFDYDGMVSLLS